MALIVVGVALVFNARSWFWYARTHQIGASFFGVLFTIALGTIVPPFQLVGLLRYRRNHYEYALRRSNGVI